MATEALDFALPQRCAMCAAPARAGLPLCESCFAAVPRWSSPLCIRCLGHDVEPIGCHRHRNWDAHAAWIYEDRVASIIHAIKFHGRMRLARDLAAEVARALPFAPRPAAIVTVPLHPLRARERGYNQVAPLARGLADIIGVPYLEHALERTRYTRPQTRLHADARRRNLLGAFRVRTPSWIHGRRVIVLDDVITTGATMSAAMRAVREAGAVPTGAALAWAQ